MRSGLSGARERQTQPVDRACARVQTRNLSCNARVPTCIDDIRAAGPSQSHPAASRVSLFCSVSEHAHAVAAATDLGVEAYREYAALLQVCTGAA